MRLGKAAAQGGHAAIIYIGEKWLQGKPPTEIERSWMNSGMKKICLRVDSEEEMLQLFEKSRAAGIESHIVVDAAATEFSIPTPTCIAIGPDIDDKIDAITGHLKPL